MHAVENDIYAKVRLRLSFCTQGTFQMFVDPGNKTYRQQSFGLIWLLHVRKLAEMLTVSQRF